MLTNSRGTSSIQRVAQFVLIGVSWDNATSRNSMSDEKVLLCCVTERRKLGFQFTKQGRLLVKRTGLTSWRTGYRDPCILAGAPKPLPFRCQPPASVHQTGTPTAPVLQFTDFLLTINCFQLPFNITPIKNNSLVWTLRSASPSALPRILMNIHG